IEKWFEKDFFSWLDFYNHTGGTINVPEGRKRMAPPGSVLADNLYSTLYLFKQHFHNGTPTIANMLLNLHQGDADVNKPLKVNREFQIVNIDYSAGLYEGSKFVELLLL